MNLHGYNLAQGLSGSDVGELRDADTQDGIFFRHQRVEPSNTFTIVNAS